MTILYVITQGETGGAQKYVATLARAAKAQNMTLNVAIGEKGDNWLGHEIEAIGGKIWPQDHLVRPISPLNDLLAIFELAQLYQKIKPNIIHLNSSKAGVLGALAGIVYNAKANNCKIIYTAHGWVFNEPMSATKKWLYLTLEKLTAKLKHHIICVSEYDRDVALANKIAPAEKLITIHNGIDTTNVKFLDRAVAQQELFGNNQPKPVEVIIGCIANFYPTKGLNYLIEAIKILIEQQQKIKVAIIGDGELRSELEKQILANDLKSIITLAGKKTDAKKYLPAFDIAVMSSVKEGFPYYILEAMTSKLPIVATKVGGVPEIIEDGKTGLLVEPKNPSDLADKIQTLIDNPGLRQNFGQAGYEQVRQEFSLEKMTRKTFETYKK